MSLPMYREYRDIGSQWLGAVPAHWSVKRLRFVVELNPSKSELAKLPKDTEVSFLPMEAIGDDGSLNLEKTRALQDVETGYTYFRDGDVTVAKITPCFENGKGALMAGLLGGIGFGTTELIVARPKSGQASAKFLNWIFQSPGFRKQGEAWMYGAGGQKRVPDDFVRNCLWCFPPFMEQEAISAFLDRETSKIDALIAEQEKLLELLAEKRQATISHTVTRGLSPDVPTKDSGVSWLGMVPEHWQVRKAGYDCTILSGFAFPSSGFSPDDSDMPLLRGVNVGVGALRWNDVVYWKRAENDGLDAFLLKQGDIVLGMDRPWISEGLRVARVSNSDTPSLLLQRVAAIRSGEEINASYLYYLFQTEFFFHHCAPEMTGVSVPHISPEQIRSFVIPVPPVSEQAAIVEFVACECTKLDVLKTEAQRSIELLNERRSALISAAVTGKIDVREASKFEELAA